MNFELVKLFECVIIVSRGNVLSMAGGVARMLQNKATRKITTKQQRQNDDYCNFSWFQRKLLIAIAWAFSSWCNPIKRHKNTKNTQFSHASDPFWLCRLGIYGAQEGKLTSSIQSFRLLLRRQPKNYEKLRRKKLDYQTLVSFTGQLITLCLRVFVFSYCLINSKLHEFDAWMT